MNASTEGTIVFASDIHLDHEVPDRIELFERFLFEILPELNCEKLYLIGDIFNIWYRDPHLAELYGDEVLRLLIEYANRGGDLEYVVGNRDFALCFDPGLDLPFPLHAKAIRRKIGDRTFYLCHGDNLLKKDYGYRLLHGSIRQKIPMAVFHWRSQKAKERWVRRLINLTHETKRRKAQWRTEPYIPYLHDLVDEGVDVCVQGHKHDTTYRVLEGQRRVGRHFVLPRWFDRAGGLIYEPSRDRFQFFDLA